MKYKMIVEIPIINVPPNVSFQEAKVKAELWLKLKIADAEMVDFKEDTK